MSDDVEAVDHDQPVRERAQESAYRAPESVHDMPESPVERLASNIGNRNFTQVVARMAEGEGIMGDGTVHADVQAAIAAMSGGGSSLPKSIVSDLAPTHGDVSDARVHTGQQADALARSVNATAFTVGSDVFFRDGAYDPNSAAGKDLLGHELAHVVQQRGAPSGGPLQVSNPGDALEREADAIASGDALA